MTSTEPTQARQALQGTQSFVRSTLVGRRGLIAAGVVIAVAGLAFNWSFLVAAGIAPALVSLLPCAAMCALGLCMNRMTGRSCSSENISAGDASDGPKALPAEMKGGG